MHLPIWRMKPEPDSTEKIPCQELTSISGNVTTVCMNGWPWRAEIRGKSNATHGNQYFPPKDKVMIISLRLRNIPPSFEDKSPFILLFLVNPEKGVKSYAFQKTPLPFLIASLFFWTPIISPGCYSLGWNLCHFRFFWYWETFFIFSNPQSFKFFEETRKFWETES